MTSALMLGRIRGRTWSSSVDPRQILRGRGLSMARWQQEPDPPVLVAGFAPGALGDLVLPEAQAG